MKLSLTKIVDFLKNNKWNYSLHNGKQVKEETTFVLASIKNKVENGIYYLSSDFHHEMGSITSSIIITDKKIKSDDSNTLIMVENPQLVHYRISTLFERKFAPGIHATAIIDSEAEIDDTAHIGPFCVIGKCSIAGGVVLMGSTTLMDNVVIKSGTTIEQNCVIGARGMAWIWDEQGNRIMQPQLGGVIVEEDCYFGTDITIVRGSLSENTIIGKGTVMAHGTKIGHGCQIGKQVHMANNVTLAGNVVVEERVFLGSGCVISSGIKIAESCIIGAGTVLTKSIEENYVTVAGVPGKIIKRNNFENKPKGAPQPFKP